MAGIVPCLSEMGNLEEGFWRSPKARTHGLSFEKTTTTTTLDRRRQLIKKGLRRIITV